MANLAKRQTSVSQFHRRLPLTHDAIAAVDSLKSRAWTLSKSSRLFRATPTLPLRHAGSPQAGLPIVGHVPDKVRIRRPTGQTSIEHLMGIFEGCSTEEDKFIRGEGNLPLLLSAEHSNDVTRWFNYSRGGRRGRPPRWSGSAANSWTSVT